MPRYQIPHDTDGMPVPIFGTIPHDGVDTTTFHVLGTVAPGAAAAFPTNGLFTDQAVYEFKFFDNADQSTGTPPNIVYAPGAASISDAPLATEDGWPASQIPVFRLRLFPGQVKVAFRNPSAAKTVLIKARRVG